MPVWLLRYLPHLAAVAALCAVVWMAYAWAYGRGAEAGTAAAVAAEQARDKALATLAAERLDRQRAEEARDAYHAELETVRNRPVPRQPVRLCKPAAVPVASPAEGTDGPAAAAGSDAGPAGADIGPDIGPDLRALALSCDETAARLRALQGWVNSIPISQPSN